MRNLLKKETGITLIALIITVILMLILAGVAISAITGQEGMFSKISDVTKEYKKQNLVEAVRTAEQHLRLDNTFDKNIEINMSNLIDKLKEISEVNEKDYIISDLEVNEETGAETVTIVDKKAGVVLDITMETNGKVTIETSIVDDISKVTRPVIELTLDPEEGTYAERVIIKVTVTEEENGIAKIQIPDENLTVNTYNNEKEVTFDFPVTENGTYTFIAENANGRKTKKSIEVKNTMSVRDITIENLGGEVTKSPTNIKISYDANPRIGGKVLTNENKYQYIIGTESETNTWKTATTTIEEETGLAVATILVNENGEIHARYFDGTTGHKTKTLNITNIDTLAPTIATLEVLEDSITQTTFTLKATGEDATSTNASAASGIAKYEFYIKNENGEFVLEKTIESTNTTENYVVSGRTALTSYTYKVIVYDAVGKSKTSSEVTVTTTAAVPTYTINTGNNQTYDGKTTGTYSNPIIPKGFAPINENEAVWGSEDGYQKGLVITDEITNGVSTGNEFVWVPVPGNQDGSGIRFESVDWKEIYGDTTSISNSKITYENCIETLTTELEESVNKNEGFYIARFEAGNEDGTLVSKKNAKVWTGLIGAEALATAESKSKYVKDSNIYGGVSTLIYGAQWDTTLNFIMAYGGDTLYTNFLTNPIGLGNYSSGDSITGTSAATTSGKLEVFCQKNIYDMAGNVWEWTMEICNNAHVRRGGYFGNTASFYPTIYRASGYNSSSMENYGFRIALYIK